MDMVASFPRRPRRTTSSAPRLDPARRRPSTNSGMCQDAARRLRQMWLTTSLLTGPTKTAFNARRTRRVFARAPAIEEFCGAGAALIDAQRTAPPFARLAVLAGGAEPD